MRPPAVATTAASNLGDTFATVNGKVTQNGWPVFDCHFVIYESTNVMMPCGPSPPFLGEPLTGPIDVSADDYDLTPGSTYFVNLSATNDGGTSIGNVISFKTQGVPPLDEILSAPSVHVLSKAKKMQLIGLADLVDAGADVEEILGIATGISSDVTGLAGLAASIIADAAAEGDVTAEKLAAMELRIIAQKDPPDPNYTVIATPVLSPRVKVSRHVATALRRLLQGWVDNGRQLAADERAWLVSYERAEAAVVAGDRQWIQRQAAATARFARATASAMRNEAAILVRLRAAFNRPGFERVSVSVKQARRLRAYVKRHGFPKPLLRTLARAGATRADVRSMEAAFVSTPTRKLAGPIIARLTSAAEIHQLTKLAEILDDYATHKEYLGGWT